MASATSLLSEDQFLCSICLDVFTDPVSTPCGHSFCKNCINEHWDITEQCQCPTCKKLYYTRPELEVNIFISEMVFQFRQQVQQRASSISSEQQAAKPGEIPCDVCTETKLKAVKSCLVCLTSFCESHLEPHLTMLGLKKHQLIDPVENLEGRICMKHNKALALFCKDDQTCVCILCTISDHKIHEVVPLQEEFELKKTEMGKTEAEIQQMIQKRNLKIQEIKHSVELSKENTDKEIAEDVEAFTKLKESVERCQARVIKMIEEKQKLTEKQAEGFIKELEQEISELKKRNSELEKLSHSEDHFNLLQSFQSLIAAPPTKDWTEVIVPPQSYDGAVKTAVAQLMKRLKNMFTKDELMWAQKYAVDVTMDPDTANPNLILSDDGKQVHHVDAKKNLPDNPERFSNCPFVLGKQTVSSGRFYFEVQVNEKTHWDLGVARESINKKGLIRISCKKGYWTMCLRNEKQYFAYGNTSVLLSLKSKPEKVGVFVDYEEGLVSFYDVDAAALIYTYTDCAFNEKLLPFLCPCLNQDGKNSTPLIISPIHCNE